MLAMLRPCSALLLKHPCRRSRLELVSCPFKGFRARGYRCGKGYGKGYKGV